MDISKITVINTETEQVIPCVYQNPTYFKLMTVLNNNDIITDITRFKEIMQIVQSDYTNEENQLCNHEEKIQQFAHEELLDQGFQFWLESQQETLLNMHYAEEERCDSY